MRGTLTNRIVILFITVGHKRSAEIRSTNYKFKTNVNMKNKTSILVGTRHFFYALLVAVIFCGCGNVDSNRVQKETLESEFGAGISVMTIDSCEYVWVKTIY